MIAEHHDNTSALPATLDGWKARADYFESLFKVEKLENAKLRLNNRNLAQRLYGRSSEKLNDAQRLLFGILDHLPLPMSDEGKELLKQARKGVDDRGAEEPKRRGGGRDRDRFAHLPEVVTLINPPEEDRAGLIWISEEVTEQVECEPAKLYRNILVRPVWGHPKREQAPIIAPLPPEATVFPGARYGLRLMIRSILGKFCDHLPLHRQEGISLREGALISRQGLMRVVGNTAHLLISIAEQLKCMILDSGYFHLDETVTKVNDPERRGRSHDAYFWGFLAPHAKAVYFKFTLTRSERMLFEIFPPKWVGDVHTDGAGWYASAFPDMPFLRHFECMMHLRRYTLAAMEANEAQMKPILKDITTLYAIERRAKKLALTHEQRGHYRQRYARPILKRMQKAFKKLEDCPALEGASREAVTYANRRWPHLMAYGKRGNGHIGIDQNPIEQRFRTTKIGRKNWIAIGHPKAGWRYAVLYTVLETCRLVGVNPESYLLWVLPQLSQGTNQTTAKGLLPHDFAELFPEQILPARTH
jgi:transposase